MNLHNTKLPAGSDPIFQAIAKYRDARAKVVAARGGPKDIPNALHNAWFRTKEKMLETTPTTAQGLQTLLALIAENWEDDFGYDDTDRFEPLFRSLARALPSKTDRSFAAHDPAFAAIAEAKRAMKDKWAANKISGRLRPGPKFDAAWQKTKAASKRADKALAAFSKTVPTSQLGALAFLEYLLDLDRETAKLGLEHPLLGGKDLEQAYTSLAVSTRKLFGLN